MTKLAIELTREMLDQAADAMSVFDLYENSARQEEQSRAEKRGDTPAMFTRDLGNACIFYTYTYGPVSLRLAYDFPNDKGNRISVFYDTGRVREIVKKRTLLKDKIVTKPIVVHLQSGDEHEKVGEVIRAIEQLESLANKQRTQRLSALD